MADQSELGDSDRKSEMTFWDRQYLVHAAMTSQWQRHDFLPQSELNTV